MGHDSGLATTPRRKPTSALRSLASPYCVAGCSGSVNCSAHVIRDPRGPYGGRGGVRLGRDPICTIHAIATFRFASMSKAWASSLSCPIHSLFRMAVPFAAVSVGPGGSSR